MAQLSTLVAEATNREESAWAELVATFSPMMRSIAISYRLTAEESADAAQTTWLRLLLHIQRIREPDRIGSWLAITMRHECGRLVRRRRREQPLEDWMAVGRDDGDGVVDRLVGDERNRILWRAVAELPPHQRRLVLAFSQESPPSYQEVADGMSIPIGSIGPTRARALSRLKTMLADQGIRDAGLDRAA